MQFNLVHLSSPPPTPGRFRWITSGSNSNYVGKLPRLQHINEKINENGPMNHLLMVTLTKELQELHENEIARNECCNKTLSHGFPFKQENQSKTDRALRARPTKLNVNPNRYPNPTGETFKHPVPTLPHV